MPFDTQAHDRTKAIDALFQAQCKILQAAFIALPNIAQDDPIRFEIEASRAAAESRLVALLGSLDEGYELMSGQYAAAISTGSLALLEALPVPEGRITVHIDYHIEPLLKVLGPTYAERLLEIAVLDSKVLIAILPLAQKQPEWRPLVARLAKSIYALNEMMSVWRATAIFYELPKLVQAWPDVLPRMIALQVSHHTGFREPIYAALLKNEDDPDVRIRKAQILTACGAKIDASLPSYDEIVSDLGSNHRLFALQDTCKDTARLAARPLGGPDDPIAA